jgi:hypothetical protein
MTASFVILFKPRFIGIRSHSRAFTGEVAERRNTAVSIVRLIATQLESTVEKYNTDFDAQYSASTQNLRLDAMSIH